MIRYMIYDMTYDIYIYKHIPCWSNRIHYILEEKHFLGNKGNIVC